LAAWLQSFTELSGIILINEGQTQKKARLKRELKRLGYLRFLDVVLFRLYYKFFLGRKNAIIEKQIIEKVLAQYPVKSTKPQILATRTPNSRETQEFIKSHDPDIMIARCKVILKPNIFELAKMGTFVMHPGICPEYRNAHGCFWALAKGDFSRVGMTLLKVDNGVDTGPMYGHFSYEFDEKNETHIEIQNRSVFDNLDEIKNTLLEISEGNRKVISHFGRGSKNWGQPWLSEFYKMKKRWQNNLKNGERSGTLLYHDVADDVKTSGFSGKDADLYKLDIKTFANHLEAIGRNLPTISCPQNISSPRPDETIIFTFDDGGVSAYTAIAPMLEKKGWRGLFFIVTDKIGSPGFLSKDQIVDLHNRGHVIGSHSHSHPMRFASLGCDRILNEWSESKKILEDILKTPVLTASVPGGFYSTEVARLAHKAGFEIIFNSEPQAKACFQGKILVIGRFGIQKHTTQETVMALAFNFGCLRNKQLIFWNFKKILKKIGGPVWIKFRKWFLN
jgi:peptidoglycan/xylan/chitin deacetylase (PgdA/CDA1 family)/folate-dependent phosphoribosylglycinamide formyltransferase PurN